MHDGGLAGRFGDHPTANARAAMLGNSEALFTATPGGGRQGLVPASGGFLPYYAGIQS